MAGALPRIAAPALSAVDGRLWIDHDAQGALVLAGLQTIGGRLAVNGAPSGLHLDALTSIGGGIELNISSQQPLGSNLPALQTIGGDLHSLLGALTSIDLPQLTRLRRSSSTPRR